MTKAKDVTRPKVTGLTCAQYAVIVLVLGAFAAYGLVCLSGVVEDRYMESGSSSSAK